MENIRKESQPDNGADRVFDIYGLSNGGNEAQCCVHIISVRVHVPRIIRRNTNRKFVSQSSGSSLSIAVLSCKFTVHVHKLQILV